MPMQFLNDLAKSLFGVDLSQILPPDMAAKIAEMQGPAYQQMGNPNAVSPNAPLPGSPPPFNPPQNPMSALPHGAEGVYDQSSGWLSQGRGSMPSVTMPNSMESFLGPYLNQKFNAFVQGPGAQPGPDQTGVIPINRAQEVRPQTVAPERSPRLTAEDAQRQMVSEDIVERVALKIADPKGPEGHGKNPRSSAEGLGQFIDSTWLSMVQRYRPDLFDKFSRPNLLKLKHNKALAMEMTRAYTQENADHLRKAGFEINEGNLYLAHFAGAGGAVKLLSADPGWHVKEVLGEKAVAANPHLKTKSVGDTIAWAEKAIGAEGISKPVSALESPLQTAARMETGRYPTLGGGPAPLPQPMAPGSIAGQVFKPGTPGINAPMQAAPQPVPTTEPNNFQTYYNPQNPMLSSAPSSAAAPSIGQPRMGAPAAGAAPMASPMVGPSGASPTGGGVMGSMGVGAVANPLAGDANAMLSPLNPMYFFAPQGTRQLVAQQHAREMLMLQQQIAQQTAEAGRQRVGTATERALEKAKGILANNPGMNPLTATHQAISSEFTRMSQDEIAAAVPYIQNAIAQPPPKTTPIPAGQTLAITDHTGRTTFGPTAPTSTASEILQLSQIANGSDPIAAAAAKTKLAQLGKGEGTQSERAMAVLVAAGVIDPIMAQKELAGVLKTFMPQDQFGKPNGPPIVYDITTGEIVAEGAKAKQFAAIQAALKHKVDPNIMVNKTAVDDVDESPNALPPESAAQRLARLKQKYKGQEDVAVLATHPDMGEKGVDEWLAKGGKMSQLPPEIRTYAHRVIRHATPQEGQMDVPTAAGMASGAASTVSALWSNIAGQIDPNRDPKAVTMARTRMDQLNYELNRYIVDSSGLDEGRDSVALQKMTQEILPDAKWSRDAREMFVRLKNIKNKLETDITRDWSILEDQNSFPEVKKKAKAKIDQAQHILAQIGTNAQIDSAMREAKARPGIMDSALGFVQEVGSDVKQGKKVDMEQLRAQVKAGKPITPEQSLLLTDEQRKELIKIIRSGGM